MEGRMMLSGTDIAPVQPVLDLTQYNFMPAEFSLTRAWISPTAQPIDGGLINVADTSVQLVHPDLLSADSVFSSDANLSSAALTVRFNSYSSGIAFDHADTYSDGRIQVLYGSPSMSLIDSGA